MADETITNGMLLQHMQGMKNDLQQQITGIHREVMLLGQKISRVDAKVDNLAQKMDAGFEDARLHRQALQEDLEATMKMVWRHEKKLARV